MLVIRLSRFGKKKMPFYRIVVAEKKAAVSGKYIEKIGHYNPLVNPPEIFVDKEKAQKWLKQGAKPSDTVWNLLVEAGVLKGKIVTQRKKKKKGKVAQKEEIKVEPEIPSSQEGSPANAERSDGETGRSASQNS